MKLILTAAFIAGFPIVAYAAAPATDHSRHEQHQQPAPQGQTSTAPAKPSTTPPAHRHGGMGEGMHQGMKMDGCCCCKKEEQRAQESCCDKNETPGSAPSEQPHAHNH